MKSLGLAVLFAVTNLIAPNAGTLRVMRVYPTDDADPFAAITVTFDRPVVADVDSAQAPARILSIEPAIEGRAEWRDPVTLRFVPATPLVADAEYRVTVANDFSALDGSRLVQPHSFTVRVRAPRVLGGVPLGSSTTVQVGERPTFRVVISDRADPEHIAARTWVTMSKECGGARIGTRFVSMRPLQRDDPSHIYYGPGVRDYRAMGDSLRDLRRFVELTPESPLPMNCKARLSLPFSFLNAWDSTFWQFRTHGPLTVRSWSCNPLNSCGTTPVHLQFSTPVSGSEVARYVRIQPAVSYTLRDTAAQVTDWFLDTRLEPQRRYTLAIDSQLTDVFGQRLGRQADTSFVTGSFAPAVSYATGPLLVERSGLRTLAVRSVNVDTLAMKSMAVPDTAEYAFLNGAAPLDEVFHQRDSSNAAVQQILLSPQRDVPFTTGVAVSAPDARVRTGGTLLAVQLNPYIRPDPRRRVPATYYRGRNATALIQVTDLAIHSRIGVEQGTAWVTGVRDGRPRAGVLVTLHDKYGKVRASARTDAQGFARLTNFRPPTDTVPCAHYCMGFEGYLSARLNDDRAVVGINSDYQSPLAPYRFQANTAWSMDQRTPAVVAVFTERAIYRPGERVYAKAIVREGPLGALTVPRRDSLKWEFLDQSGAVLEDTITALSAFGTAHQALLLGRAASLGYYQVRLSLRRAGAWQSLGSAGYRVAEYRAPEFLADMTIDTTARMAGDTLSADISARYLFGAPMANAEVRWTLQQRVARPWELGIPNTADWHIGEYANTDYYTQQGTYPLREDTSRLDARGTTTVRVALPGPSNGTAARTELYAVVTDANRQSVTVARRVVVHAAGLYVGARMRGRNYFWNAGRQETIEVIALRPDGERVAGVPAEVAIIRNELKYTHAVSGPYPSGMISDTVATCTLQTRAEPVSCQFTPARGGSYVVKIAARDPQGRTARTSFERWAFGPGRSEPRFNSPFQIEITADRPRYQVGDTATLAVFSPFSGVEAWLTIERERVLESRRMRLDSGLTTVKVPITEALAPNALVSVLLVRGRSAAPGPFDDPGRPTLRVGYAELRVATDSKRLAVQVTPLRAEYQPGDTARVRVTVKEPGGRGRRAEVTLWAVDEGVLALTDYRVPDPVELIYRPRGTGMRLASNLVSVAPQVPNGLRGPDTLSVPVPRPAFGSEALALSALSVRQAENIEAAPQPASPDGGSAQRAAIMRSQFQSTAFFIGSVITDANGNAVAAAKLPDNLTTFRIMAVAVTAGDRYGSGTSSLLVTRPLLARPSLPRFLRAGDRFDAGVVVNQRTEGTQHVAVDATARGAELIGDKTKTDTLRGTAGREVRFLFAAQPVDTARFQFAVRGRSSADAVTLPVPLRPSYHPLAQTIAGVLRDTALAEFRVAADIDPARSRLEINFGSSVLSIIKGVHNTLRVYPYACTEQVASSALPLIALYRAQKELGMEAGIGLSAQDEIRAAVRTLSWRQQADGSIGYWGPHSWSTPGVTAHATRVLLEARAAGFAVDSAVFLRIRTYLTGRLRESERPRFAVNYGFDERQLLASERLAAVDVLSRLGHADVPAEDLLLTQIADLHWEDRILLAEVLARRGAVTPARTLLAQAWAGVIPEGRTFTLPPGSNHYLRSNTRPAARLLSATLAIEPADRRVGPLVETLIQQGRSLARLVWNTHDYASVVLALLPYERQRRQVQGPARIQLRGDNGLLISRDLQSGEPRDTSIALSGLVNGQSVRLSLTTQSGAAPVYYYLTLREVPRTRPVRPVDNGIQVERWYERADARAAVTTVTAGELVRVRLRITVPDQRHFVVVDDPLPAGLEAVDPTLRTEAPMGAFEPIARQLDREPELNEPGWAFGRWYWGQWSPFDHKELRDDRVIHFATILWKGTWTASYLARATTTGSFVMPPAHAEEMYNPAVNGRTGGGVFTVRD